MGNDDRSRAGAVADACRRASADASRAVRNAARIKPTRPSGLHSKVGLGSGTTVAVTFRGDRLSEIRGNSQRGSVVRLGNLSCRGLAGGFFSGIEEIVDCAW